MNNDPAADETGCTISFFEYRKKMEKDNNDWWRTASGHQLNLFEDACSIIDDLTGLLEDAVDTIEGLADQQAMPDDWYLPIFSKLKDKLKELKDNKD